MSLNNTSRRIKKLREDVSRRIAAGEVIDRPFSVLRELIDNSLDAECEYVDISIREGGMSEIRVRDDGTGMARDDLKLCIEPHATSKIVELDDLSWIRSLGFRGEALSSVAAVAKLEIISRTPEAEAYRIIVHGGSIIRESETAAQSGTTVLVQDLFYTMPARKRFLSKASTEANRCRQTVIEKALPFPSVSFRYHVEDQLKLSLTRCDQKTSRISEIFSSQLHESLLCTGNAETRSAKVEVVTTNPSYSRRDRRMMYLYVNNRRVDDFSLIQAVQYGYEPFLPGGKYPAAFVFVHIDPSEIDFNIHPAKREVRFSAKKEIHHVVLEAIRDATREFSGTVTSMAIHKPPTQPSAGAMLDFHVSENSTDYRLASRKPVPDFSALKSALPVPGISHDPDTSTAGNISYLGQLFSLFLLIEKDDRLFIIDQHAAHERILFDTVREKPGDIQNLLVPRKIDTEAIPTSLMRNLSNELLELGVTIEENQTEGWFLKSVPGAYRGMEQVIVEFIEENNGSKDNLERELFALYSCRNAIKDNDILDPITARELAVRALELPEPRCPHGRPIWHEISREMLFSLVGRT
jgi:DNA mismatch repair protein MutL